MFSSENTGSSVRGPDGAEVRRQTSSSTVLRNLSARAMEATSCCRAGFGGTRHDRGDVDAVGSRLASASGERFKERTRAWSYGICQLSIAQDQRTLTLNVLFASFSERLATSADTSEGGGPGGRIAPPSGASLCPFSLSVFTEGRTSVPNRFATRARSSSY